MRTFLIMNFCSGLNCFVFLLSFLSFSHASVDHTDQVFFSNGSFTMGSARRDLLSTGEYPQKEIKVRAFFIDKYPVTNKDFKIFKSEKPLFLTDAEIDGYSWVLRKHKNTNAIEESRLSHPDNEHWAAVRNASWFMPYGPGSDLEGMDNHPVVHVTHYDAIAFCSWAGKRLVSEFEWEFAARGGEKDLLLPWGNLQELYRSNLWQGRFPDMDFGKDGYDTLSPVNAYDRQNDYGMHDMMGNVWEWTSTLFTIPRVPRDPKNPLYTIRGGSFIDAYDGKANDPVRITMRKGLNPGYRAENVGFRCAYFHDPKNPTGKLRRARKPKIHRYEDTWEYKQNLAMHRTDEL